jgi:signal transduction histidine kinase
MTSRLVVVIILALLFGATSNCAATDIHRMNESWRWVRFGAESGLPSERVERVLETRNREIWARTTPGGVAYFDGYRWTRVTIPGLEHTDETSFNFAEDSVGILLFHSGSVYHVDRDTAFQIRVAQTGLPVNARSALWYNGDHIFVGDSTLFRLLHGAIVPFPSPYDTVTSPSEPKFMQNRVLQARKSLLLKVGREIFRFVNGKWVSDFRSPTDYLRVYLTGENAAGQGLAVLQTSIPHQDIYAWESGRTPTRVLGEEGDIIRSFDVSPDGETLLLLKSGALRLLHHGKYEVLPPFPSPVISPLQVLFSANGDLWVCTERGLFLCRLSSERWTKWSTGPPGRASMVNNIIQTRDGSFWFGTADGICMRSPNGQNHFIREIHGVVLGSITAVTEDVNGDVWIGSGSTFRGAFRWNGKRWQHVGVAEGLTAQGRTAPFIHKIVLTRSKELWFCAMAASSERLEEEPGAFRYVKGVFQRVSRKDGLLDNRLYSVAEDRNGALWFGSRTGVSSVYRGEWKTWKSAEKFNGDYRVYAIAVDSSNNIWVGRQHNGLSCIDTAGRVINYAIDDGLVGNSVWDLQVDSVGLLWIGTREGVGCYDGARWMSFDVHTGLPNSEIWPILVKNRRVYIGTEGAGVAVLSLDHLNDNPHRVKLETPLVEDKRVTLSWEVNAYWADVPATQIETRYRIEGGKWSSWSTARLAVFKGLDPGTYRFMVEPRQTSKQGVPEVRMISFTIPPPLYLRPMVAMPITILGLLVLALAGVVWDRKRRYDQSIRDSEARLRAQYRSNPVPTFTWKREGNDFLLADVNDAAIVFTNGQEVKWIGRKLNDLLANRPEVIEMIYRCFRERSVLREEFRMALLTARREADLSVTYSYVQPDMVLTHVEDVTERKRSEAKIRESREQLRALASRLESVREEERTQLSREIHDELGQLMTGLKMDLAWIRKRSTDYGEHSVAPMQERIQQMNTLLDQSIQTVRKIAGQLRPALLDELGLVAAMEWQSREWQTRTGIDCHYDVLTDEPQFSRERATELFRIFQELLTNVARHAGASKVTVTLYQADSEVCLEVHDNGRGIRDEEINRPVSLGILGMKERAARIGGRIAIAGEPGKGTNVRVSIPIQGDTQ